MGTSPEPRTMSPTHHCFPITSREGEAHHLGGANRDLKTGPETVQVTAPKLPMIKCTGQLRWFDSGYCNKENVPYWGKSQRRETKLGVLLNKGVIEEGQRWSYLRIWESGVVLCILRIQKDHKRREIFLFSGSTGLSWSSTLSKLFFPFLFLGGDYVDLGLFFLKCLIEFNSKLSRSGGLCCYGLLFFFSFQSI